MSKAILLVLSIFLLVGCGKETIRYERYPVPVYQVPAPPELERPELPIHGLPGSTITDTGKLIQAYVVSVRLLLNYAEAKEAIVTTYKKLSEESNLEDDFPTRALAATGPDERREEQLSEEDEVIIMSNNARMYDEAQSEFNKIEEEYKNKEDEIWEEFNEEDE